MDYNALAAELSADPLARGYAEYLPHAPGVVADMLNAHTAQLIKSRFITARTVMAEGGAEGVAILDALETAAQSNSTVRWALQFFTQDSGLDIGHEATQTTIDQLVLGAVLTTEQGTLLKNMALQPASRAEVLGLPPVSSRDVQIALGE